MGITYQDIEYKKHQKVKFVNPTDIRIVDPQTNDIIWQEGVIQFFSKKKLSAYIKIKNLDSPVKISLFCVIPCK